MLSDKIIDLLTHITFPIKLPEGVEVMNPFSDEETLRIINCFYHKYYNDIKPRYFVIGINPGRFGGGVTGIPFTDLVRLQTVCEIENSWAKKQELSSVFIYEMIDAFGGAESFYKRFYFTAVSLLGFTKNGKNLNYYDDKVLGEKIIPFAVEYLKKQIAWGMNTDIAFCLGEGANYKFLSKINIQYNLFNKIIPLPHPRFIMQYKLKTKDAYIDHYLEQFSMAK